MKYIRLYESFDFQEDWIEENNTLEDVKNSNVYWSIKFIKPEKKIKLNPINEEEWKESINFPYYESLFKKLVGDPSLLFDLIVKFLSFYDKTIYKHMSYEPNEFYLDWTHSDGDETVDNFTFELDVKYYGRHEYKNLGDLEEWVS